MVNSNEKPNLFKRLSFISISISLLSIFNFVYSIQYTIFFVKRKIIWSFLSFSIRSQNIVESHQEYFVLCLVKPSYLDRVN
jgi:hypothetical protein